MATKDFRGKEIIISIGKGDEKDRPPAKLRGGMLPPGPKPGGPLKRRILDDEPLTDFGLDIYDLGLTAAGDDLDFRHENILEVNAGVGQGSNYSISNRNFSVPFTAAVIANLAGGSGNRITPANVDQYDEAAPVGGTWDETRGWVSGSAGHIFVANRAPFYFFNTVPGADGGIETTPGGPAYTKITESLDYNAPSAAETFVRDRDAELFLSPRVFNNNGESRVGFQFSGGGTTYDRYIANYFAEPLPRSYFLNNAAWEAFRGRPMFETGYNMFYRGDTSPATATFTGNQTVVDSWRTFMQSRPGARLWKWTVTKSTNTLLSQGADAPGNFPTYYPGATPVPPFATSPFYNNVRLPAYFYNDAQEASFYISPGLFLGALRLKPTDDLPEKWFYFWRVSSTVLWSLSTIAQAPGGGSIFGARWEVRV